jgi:hypothetical protein
MVVGVGQVWARLGLVIEVLPACRRRRAGVYNPSPNPHAGGGPPNDELSFSTMTYHERPMSKL